MKSTVFWKNRFILFGMMVMALFISGCSGDDLTPKKGNDPTTPWAVSATEDTWLTTNPYENKHDGGWVYSAREDVIYAIYGNDNSGRNLYRIDHIGQTSEVVATSLTVSRHGSHPVIDSTGTYIYLPPSESDAGLERYNTETDTLETLATAPYGGQFSHGAWKNDKLWIVLNDENLYSYDPATNTWSAALYDFGAQYANVAASGPGSNLIYIILNGGAFYSYDVTNGTVVPLTPHPHGFGLGGNGEFTWFGADIGFIYAVGDYGVPAIYDIANVGWEDLSDPKNNYDYAGHATYDSKRMRLYIVGGDDDQVWYYQY